MLTLINQKNWKINLKNIKIIKKEKLHITKKNCIR